MNKDIIIENYLSRLEKELKALPTGERAEILTEIRSHILEAGEKNPEKKVGQLLDAMGTPEAVAARYLMQKGVPYKAPVSSGRRFLRIFAAGMAGLFALAIASTLFAIWYFSPLLKVDESKGRVTLLGGLIDVNEPAGEVKIGGMHIKSDMTANDLDELGEDVSINIGGSSHHVSGAEDLTDKKVNAVRVPFNNAKLEIAPSTSRRLEWSCKSLANAEPVVAVSAGVMTLDLNKSGVAKCELKIPDGVKADIQGINGKIEISQPRADYDVKVTNGKVEISPDPSRVYDFEVKVANGIHDNFTRSSAKGALKVKVDVTNGVVKKE